MLIHYTEVLFCSKYTNILLGHTTLVNTFVVHKRNLLNPEHKVVFKFLIFRLGQVNKVTLRTSDADGSQIISIYLG